VRHVRYLFYMAVETLGEAYQEGWRITARCAWGNREGMKAVRECTHRYQFDMQMLVWTRGRDFPLSRLESRLRCPRCGSRRLVVMYEPPRLLRTAT
jgi:hypothetical protein